MINKLDNVDITKKKSALFVCICQLMRGFTTVKLLLNAGYNVHSEAAEIQLLAAV